MDMRGTIKASENVNATLQIGGGGGFHCDFDEKIIPYDNRIHSNEEGLRLTREQVITLGGQVSNLNEQMQTVNDSIENHTEQIGILQDDTEYLEEEVTLNTTNINNLNTSVNNISQTVQQNSTDIEELKQRPSGGSSIVYQSDERECGTYFGQKLYERSYEITGTFPQNSDVVAIQNFDIPYQNVVELKGNIKTSFTADGTLYKLFSSIPETFCSLRMSNQNILIRQTYSRFITLASVMINIKYTKGV